MSARDFVLADAAATERAGGALAFWMREHRPNGVLYLSGALGAGKTSLARGLLRGLGVAGAVRSPSYTLVEPYATAIGPVLHMDLYRLHDAEELEGLGLRDSPPDRSWWLVEWPERAAGRLPAPALEAVLQTAEPGRHLRVSTDGPAAERLFSLLAAACGRN